MKIEILFPEYANLFGDMGNILYLKACLPQAEFIETAMNDAPRFLSEPVDLIYMGPMSEAAQEKIIARLMPCKEKMQELIEAGTCFLFTGNAVETLYQEIEDGNRKIPGLQIPVHHGLWGQFGELFRQSRAGHRAEPGHAPGGHPPEQLHWHQPHRPPAGDEPALYPLAAGRYGRERRAFGL